MEFYSALTIIPKEVERKLEVYRLVQTYSKDYCIRSLGVSKSEYCAAVNEGAIKSAEEDRENTRRVSRLMSQVFGSEEEQLEQIA